MGKSENRKYLLFFSSVLVGQQYLNLTMGETIPYTNIPIPDEKNWSIILTLLVVHFGFQYILEWAKQPKETRVRLDLIPSVPLAIFAICTACINYLTKFGITWPVAFLAIVIFASGGFLAIAVDFFISIVFSIRNSDEMKKMGLGRISYVSVALIRANVYTLLPITTLALYFLAKYSYALPSPLKGCWLTIFFGPAILFNFPSFINIIKCLGPSKMRKKAREELCCRKAMDIHEMLIQFGSLNVKDHELPPICTAAQTGDLTSLQEMLNNCINPNEQDPRGWSPLMYATAEKNTDCVKLLLEHGADPNVINFLGRSAIMYAASYGFNEIIELLLEKGASPNISNEGTTAPPLFNAAGHGHLKTVQLLIEHGANVMSTSNHKTALDAAVHHKHGDVAKYLRNKMLELDKTPLEEKTDLVKNIKWLDK